MFRVSSYSTDVLINEKSGSNKPFNHLIALLKHDNSEKLFLIIAY